MGLAKTHVINTRKIDNTNRTTDFFVRDLFFWKRHLYAPFYYFTSTHRLTKIK